MSSDIQTPPQRQQMAAIEAALQDHPHAKLVLTGSLARTQPNHALLFSGPAGVGKALVAREYAACLLAGDDDFEPVRGRVLRDTHPDLTWVRPTGASQMRREDLTDPVIRAATRTPMESARRVFVLERVELMNDATAASFLKTLEEPAEYAHFILLTDAPERVLSTIRSRCQIVQFSALPLPRVAAQLTATGVDQQTADSCAALSRGDLQLAAWLASDEGSEVRTEAGRIVAAALRGVSATKRPWQPVVQRATKIGAATEQQQIDDAQAAIEALPKGRERNALTKEAEQAAHRANRHARTDALDRSLSVAANLLRDLAVTAADCPEFVLTTDRRSVIEKNASGRKPTQLLRAAAEVDGLRRQLRANVAEELALQALCLRLDDLIAVA
ncbi:MAG: hypothetical protein JHC87_10345 [Thermoleophilaceae bacterium]|nr:hypothetical protein [Thermoleophilaceae bacterium]